MVFYFLEIINWKSLRGFNISAEDTDSNSGYPWRHTHTK